MANEKNFIVKKGITIGQGGSNPFSLPDTDGISFQVLGTDGSGNVTWVDRVISNEAITPQTKTKITYDAKGLVTAGADLVAADIPDLDANKITTGGFVDARITQSSVTQYQAALSLTESQISDLANYALDNTVVKLTGNQTIAGTKTFSDEIVVDGYDKILIDGQQVSSKDYVQSRGQNLVTNGFGLLENNTNFSGFDYYPVDRYAGGGSFTVSSSGNATKLLDELIAVDPTKQFRLSYAIKGDSGGETPPQRHYGMLAFYDADKNQISPQHVLWRDDTLTTLAQPLAPGDTEIHLVSSSGWYDADQTHRRSIVFYPYTNHQGFTYDVGGYSRHVNLNVYGENGINYSTHVITLSSPWSGASNPEDAQGIWPTGTPVANAYSGGTYAYIAGSNEITPADWTIYSGAAGGINEYGSGAASAWGFWPGTAFVQVGWLLNRDAPGTSTSWIDAVSYGLDVAEAIHTHTESDITDLGNYSVVGHTHVSADITDLEAGKPANSHVVVYDESEEEDPGWVAGRPDYDHVFAIGGTEAPYWLTDNDIWLEEGGEIAFSTAGDGLTSDTATVSVDDTVVRTTGNQTIAGVKTFSGELQTDMIKSLDNSRTIQFGAPNLSSISIRNSWVVGMTPVMQMLEFSKTGILYTKSMGAEDPLGVDFTSSEFFKVTDLEIQGQVATIPGTSLGTTGTITLDFSGPSLRNTGVLTGNITFAASNYAAGRVITVLITNGSTERTLSFPSGWRFVGSKPESIGADKIAILTLTSFAANEANVVAAYAEEE